MRGSQQEGGERVKGWEGESGRVGGRESESDGMGEWEGEIVKGERGEEVNQ